MLTIPEDETVIRVVEEKGPILSIDIGSRVQVGLLALPGQQPETWPRFVLPSPALAVADRIRKYTHEGRSVWLYGRNMGACFRDVVKEQLDEGLSPAATPEAVMASYDNPEPARSLDVEIIADRPSDHAAVYLTDYDADFWKTLLASAGLPAPVRVVAAVEDHGVRPENKRDGRFLFWKELLDKTAGDPAQWLYDAPPSACARLRSLHQCTGGPVADTGAAAVLGGLATPQVSGRSQRQGVTVVNVGDHHVTAFLVYRGKILGIYEHHTGLLDADALLFDLKEFRFGWLPDEQVQAKGGHGCAFLYPLPQEAEGFTPTFIVGPRREMLRGQGQSIAPYGDMTLVGCHGLLYGLGLRERR